MHVLEYAALTCNYMHAKVAETIILTRKMPLVGTSDLFNQPATSDFNQLALPLHVACGQDRPRIAAACTNTAVPRICDAAAAHAIIV